MTSTPDSDNRERFLENPSFQCWNQFFHHRNNRIFFKTGSTLIFSIFCESVPMRSCVLRLQSLSLVSFVSKSIFAFSSICPLVNWLTKTQKRLELVPWNYFKVLMFSSIHNFPILNISIKRIWVTQQQAIAMRHSFRTELLFKLEVGFLENDIFSFYRN